MTAAAVSSLSPDPTLKPVTHSPASPQTHAVTGGRPTDTDEPRATPSPSPTPSTVPTPGNGIWTPLNPNCQADCFVDLTEEEVQKVGDYYQGSFEIPSSPDHTPEFKGLPNPPLDHFACEYFHTAGYIPGLDACKGVL